jgi:hypothetical protein
MLRASSEHFSRYNFRDKTREKYCTSSKPANRIANSGPNRIGTVPSLFTKTPVHNGAANLQLNVAAEDSWVDVKWMAENTTVKK